MANLHSLIFITAKFLFYNIDSEEDFNDFFPVHIGHIRHGCHYDKSNTWEDLHLAKDFNALINVVFQMYSNQGKGLVIGNLKIKALSLTTDPTQLVPLSKMGWLLVKSMLLIVMEEVEKDSKMAGKSMMDLCNILRFEVVGQQPQFGQYEHILLEKVSMSTKCQMAAHQLMQGLILEPKKYIGRENMDAIKIIRQWFSFELSNLPSIHTPVIDSQRFVEKSLKFSNTEFLESVTKDNEIWSQALTILYSQFHKPMVRIGNF